MLNSIIRLTRTAATSAVIAAALIGSPASAADKKSSEYAFNTCRYDRWQYLGFSSYDDCFDFYKAQYEAECYSFEDGGQKYCY